MSYVVIDTESNGLFNYRLPADAPGQPRVAAVAMVMLDEDLRVVREYFRYIRPDGWSWDDESEAAHINGLTAAKLMAEGVPIAEVLDEFSAVVRAGAVICAHNAQHDMKHMRAELRHAGRDDLFENTYQFCTMREWAAANHTKWPKLIDLCTMLGIEHEGPHKAIADAKATAQLLPHFRRIGIAIDGRVHRSKYHPERTG